VVVTGGVVPEEPDVVFGVATNDGSDGVAA
jgi:hypothetical protein